MGAVKCCHQEYVGKWPTRNKFGQEEQGEKTVTRF